MWPDGAAGGAVAAEWWDGWDAWVACEIWAEAWAATGLGGMTNSEWSWEAPALASEAEAHWAPAAVDSALVAGRRHSISDFRKTETVS